LADGKRVSDFMPSPVDYNRDDDGENEKTDAENWRPVGQIEKYGVACLSGLRMESIIQ